MATRRGSTVNGGRPGQPAAPATFMKIQGPLQCDKLDNTVSYMTRYGMVARSRGYHTTTCTEAQRSAQLSLRHFSQMWGTLSDQERAAWNKRAIKTRSRPRAGQSGALTGHALFVRKGVNPEIGIQTVGTEQAALRRITAANLRFDPFFDPFLTLSPFLFHISGPWGAYVFPFHRPVRFDRGLAAKQRLQIRKDHQRAKG